jgi:aspartate-semialdehyde dehydrogenase
MKVAVVGATGLVGRKILDVLLEREFPISALSLFASARTAGTIQQVGSLRCEIIELTAENIQSNPVDIALFSAGGEISKQFAPLFVKAGAVVIDNSSYWRMNDDVPLIVPEVNASAAKRHKGIIANPNCSTIQMVVALKPLHDAFLIKRVVVSTYQSVTGAGKKGETQLENELLGQLVQEPAFLYPIAKNAIPQIDVFLDSGYSKEEWKMIVETQKILDPAIFVSPTAVRIPTDGGHSESLNIEFEKPFELDTVRLLLSNFKGVTVVDDVSSNSYPMPLTAKDKDDVFVGRIRRDQSISNGLHLWVVSDNLRKGAATNAVQIAELFI